MIAYALRNRKRGPAGGRGHRGVLHASSTTNEMKNKDDQGDHEQQMDESAGDMKRKSAAPKEQKKNGDN